MAAMKGRAFYAQSGKYHATPVDTKDGHFDSLKEWHRWLLLKDREKAGEITDLRKQVPYLLIPSQYGPDIIGPRGGRKQGKCIETSVKYIADFVYTEDGHTVVEDTKGFRTKEYIIKRKLMLYVHGIRITEV